MNAQNTEHLDMLTCLYNSLPQRCVVAECVMFMFILMFTCMCCRECLQVFVCAFVPLKFKFSVGRVAARLRVRGQADDINGTSRGEGLNLHAIQIAPNSSLTAINRQKTAAWHAPTPSESVNMGHEKTEESDLNWPLHLTTHLVLAKGQEFN